jgi:hypothetical protein
MSHSPKHSHSPAVSPDSIARGHETTDATPNSILWFSIYLTVTLAVTIVISLLLFSAFAQTADTNTKADYPTSPLASSRPPSPAPPIQPSPGHETLPRQDITAYLEDYDRLSRSYGNELMADNTAHDRMPVEAAMQLLAQNGIPAGAATDVPTPQGPANSVPTPYSPGGRGSNTGTAAAPGVPQQ